MRILLIKMSSMGDVFHTFPALSDAQLNLPGLVVDWVVEESFSQIANWHPIIDKVYPIKLRAWRKSVFSADTRSEMKTFFETLNQTKYDLVIDAQGLLKSLWVGKKINAPIAGYDWASIREPLASLFYQYKYPVSKNLHAIERIRELFALSLGYRLEDNAPIIYGLNTQAWLKPSVLTDDILDQPYVVFLHGTTWETKYWPEENWIALRHKMEAEGLTVILPWGNEEERLRANRIASHAQNDHTPQGGIRAWVPERSLTVNEVAQILNFAKGVVSVDTGLSHVAASLEVPMVVMYRVTDPKLVGADGSKVIRLSSPCAPLYLKKFTKPDQVKTSLKGLGVKEVLDQLGVCKS
ncbi:MAG: lipopolysaccharide heptosyltransferase I [Gammaproteobacteria bacterium]|nr:lipopolysaccharide heptosyltransferase I [Gammaproteobacteria bacterium]